MISWPPSQWWDGDDGSWSSFALRIGTPAQVVRVLPSTAGQQTWVISPTGCPNGTSSSSPCSQARGGLFQPAQSKSWRPFGNYTVDLEVDLGYDYSAPLGLDTVALGFSDSIGGPTIRSQVVSALAPYDFYLGVFGLGHQSTNVSNFTNPYPSFLTAMKNENLIPSLSWAYTAGAPYQSKGAFGSLTFGGYDRSRFIQNNISMSLASDATRDLVVGLNSITSTSTNESTTQQRSLLPSPILAFIDSTLPYIYLPHEACEQFERTLGLYWNETNEMYWVNDTLHESLMSSNLTFTFSIGDTNAEGPTVQIVLPYASFDLEVKYPFENETTRYFPLQQAVNESQYTLGRAFLQEAYVITDYERSNFSVSQSRFEEKVASDLVSIPSKDGVPADVVPSPSATPPATVRLNHKHRNIIVGTSVGAASFLIIVVVLAVLVIRTMQSRGGKQAQIRFECDSTGRREPLVEPQASADISAQEIGNNSLIGEFREAPDNGIVELLAGDSPSAGDDASSRTPETGSHAGHELSIRRGSRIYLHTDETSSGRIYLSTGILRDSRTDNPSPSVTSGVENVVLASHKLEGSEMEAESIATSNIEAAIYSSYMRKSLDLNRSLPPTPISESPQRSPAAANFKRVNIDNSSKNSAQQWRYVTNSHIL